MDVKLTSSAAQPLSETQHIRTYDATVSEGPAPMEPDLSAKGLLLDIDRFASHDGPGIRTAVFLKGCPLRCRWCHSPESQLAQPEILYQRQRCTGCGLCLEVCPEGIIEKEHREGCDVAILDRERCTGCGECVEVCYPNALRMGGKLFTVGELVEKVARDLPFFQASGGGVTLSGGEPAMQPKFSHNFLLACRQRGMHTALETTGHAPWDIMLQLSEVTDLLLYDLKMLDGGLHEQYTGVSNDRILANLEQIAGLGRSIQLRIPCIPGLNDSAQHIQSIAKLAKRLQIGTIALLPYNPATEAKYEWIGRPYTLNKRNTQTTGKMEALAALCVREGIHVQIGG